MQTGVINGDCCEVMPNFGSGSVDLVVIDPPYLVDYHSTDGRSYPIDNDGAFLTAVFIEIFCVLKNDSFCVSFYGWPRAEEFLLPWKNAGFRPVGHIVWTKRSCVESRCLELPPCVCLGQRQTRAVPSY
jgi:site-specific DNA-methyltransferase (adenine-specific)